MELRIATYNIHKGASIDHRPIIQELKRSIRSLGASVIFLQEVQGRHDLQVNGHALLMARNRGNMPILPATRFTVPTARIPFITTVIMVMPC